MNANLFAIPSSGAVQLPTPNDLGSMALLLDVDGTILDTAITPDSVVVPRSFLSSLRELHAMSGGALALVSGRLIRDMDAVLHTTSAVGSRLCAVAKEAAGDE